MRLNNRQRFWWLTVMTAAALSACGGGGGGGTSSDNASNTNANANAIPSPSPSPVAKADEYGTGWLMDENSNNVPLSMNSTLCDLGSAEHCGGVLSDTMVVAPNAGAATGNQCTDWTSQKVYLKGNLVKVGDKTYKALRAVRVFSPATYTTYWQLDPRNTCAKVTPPAVETTAYSIPYVPAASDQKATGLCAAFSVAHQLSAMANKYNNITDVNTINLDSNIASPRYLYTAMPDNVSGAAAVPNKSICNGSWATNLYIAAVARNGIATVATTPLNPLGSYPSNQMSKNNCQQSELAKNPSWVADARFKPDGYRAVSPKVDLIKAELKLNNVVFFGAKLNQAFYEAGNDQTLLTRPLALASIKSNDPHAAGHAMIITGFDDAKKAFKVQNSWGPNFGDKGIVWIDYALMVDTSNWLLNSNLYVAYKVGTNTVSQLKSVATELMQNANVTTASVNPLDANDVILGVGARDNTRVNLTLSNNDLRISANTQTASTSRSDQTDASAIYNEDEIYAALIQKIVSKTP
jgi:hypothetical protein